MPKFKVVSNIEHNETQYWPEPPAGAPSPPREAPGFGSGKPVPVNSTGIIEFTDADVETGVHKHLLTGGAIEPLREVKKEASSKQQAAK